MPENPEIRRRGSAGSTQPGRSWNQADNPWGFGVAAAVRWVFRPAEGRWLGGKTPHSRHMGSAELGEIYGHYFDTMNATTFPSRLLRSLALISVFIAGPVSRGYSQVVTVAGADGMAAPEWTEINNDHFDQRSHFSAGTQRLLDRLDEQIRLLKTKRADMTTDPKDWDFAMKDVEESRSLLTGRMTELAKATTPETWADAKDKFAEAWKRSQLAVDRMHTTVTC